MANRIEGSKYQATKDLDATAIAKLIRADLKAACKSGALPSSLKVSVRTCYASMMQAIDITIVSGLPAGFEVLNRDRLRGDESANILSADATKLLEAVEAIRDAYNYDNSDSMTDYSDVNFYGSVDFSNELISADRERAESEPVEAAPAAPAVSSQEAFLAWVGA